MATFKFLLWSHDPNAEGLFPVYFRVSKNNSKKYISVGLTATELQWDTKAERFKRFKRDKRINSEYDKYNTLLNEYENRATDIVNEFAKSRIDWTLNQFEDKFLNKAKRGRIQLYFQNVIGELKETGHTGNSNCYARTLHMLQLFDRKFNERIFQEVDIKYVKGFDVWMQKPRVSIGKEEKRIQREGCSGNTRKYYMKALRAILNKAIQEGEAPAGTYPFGKGGFEVGKLEEETEKRYLPSDYLKRLKEGTGQSDTTETARRMFLFSYYCYGISFADMAQLGHRNIIKHEGGDYIVYKRQKTKNQKKVSPIQIRITDEISGLLEWFKDNT
ncbi:hypothetical protein Barb6_02988 [Bacteroidales bacterium Barb6]|nr:hypothetical protein Barb6_02988 [Bacteroidales bacterium Barb6]